jgi:hypothetical protein
MKMSNSQLKTHGIWLATWAMLGILAFDWWNWGLQPRLFLGWLPDWVAYQFLLQAALIVHAILFVYRRAVPEE